MTRPCSLVVDSGAVLDEGRYAGTQVVPLRIVFGEQVLRDGIDITADSFYARLEIGDVPTTSTPSPGEYLEAFRASDAESDIVCLTIPRSLSAMNESAACQSGVSIAERVPPWPARQTIS